MTRERKRVNAALIRKLNIARIFHALRVHPDATQREVAKHAALDAATVSTVLRSLEERGLVERRHRATEGRVGRPESVVRIPERAGTLLGARLEPATIRVVATDLTGRILERRQVAGSTEIDQALDLLDTAVRDLLAARPGDAAPLRGFGVGVPGLIDDRGRLAFAPNLGWRDIALHAILAERFDVPVYVDNDTKAAGLAEKLFGACRDARDFVFIAGHSGVGAALHLDGRLYRGSSGFAGEFGHVKVRPGGRACGCGGHGCVEAYVSEPALLEQAAERGIVVAGLKELAAAADAGDERVLALLEDAGTILGEACANLVNLLSPQRIVLGGNLALVGGYLVPSIELAIQAWALEAPRERCVVMPSPLGVESVPLGGVALAMEGFLGLPAWLAASEIGAALA